MSKYSISLATSDEAKKFWNLSPNATAFTNPEVMNFFNYNFEWWQAKRGEEVLCMWPVCLESKSKVVLPEFSYYFGPIWFKDFYKIPNHSWLALSKNIYEIFIEKFVLKYGVVNAQLPLGLQDIRIFNWWNYHNKKENRFIIQPKYTAQIKDLDKLSFDQIKSNFRYWRRNELKKIEQNREHIKKSNNYSLEEIVKFYYKITGIEQNKYDLKLERINSFMNLVKNKFGEIICYRDKKSNDIASFMLVLFGKNESNLILSLVDEKWKKIGLSVFSILEAIVVSKKKNLNIFDFNGANSPNRADDKHSYGANHELFFEINYLEKN